VYTTLLQLAAIAAGTTSQTIVRALLWLCHRECQQPVQPGPPAKTVACAGPVVLCRRLRLEPQSAMRTPCMGPARALRCVLSLCVLLHGSERGTRGASAQCLVGMGPVRVPNGCAHVVRWDADNSLAPILATTSCTSQGAEYSTREECESDALLAVKAEKGARSSLSALEPLLARPAHVAAPDGPPVGCSISAGEIGGMLGLRTGWRAHWNPAPGGADPKDYFESGANGKNEVAGYLSVCRPSRTAASDTTPIGLCNRDLKKTYDDGFNTEYNTTMPEGTVCYAKCRTDDMFYDVYVMRTRQRTTRARIPERVRGNHTSTHARPHLRSPALSRAPCPWPASPRARALTLRGHAPGPAACRCRYRNLTVQRRTKAAFTCTKAGMWWGEMSCPDKYNALKEANRGQPPGEVWLPTWTSIFESIGHAERDTKNSGHALAVEAGGVGARCQWVRTKDLPHGAEWLSSNVHGDCASRDCGAALMTAQRMTTFNAVHCHSQVWVKDGRFYRVLPDAFPFAGSLQRAERTEVCGIQGDMAAPDGPLKQSFLRKVPPRACDPALFLWERLMFWQEACGVGAHMVRALVFTPQPRTKALSDTECILAQCLPGVGLLLVAARWCGQVGAREPSSTRRAPLRGQTTQCRCTTGSTSSTRTTRGCRWCKRGG